MTNGSALSNRVVDLLRYKATRRQRRLVFEPAAPPTSSLATIAPFRPLTADAVRHRQQMLRHLTRSR
jgi:hypothetical protein